MKINNINKTKVVQDVEINENLKFEDLAKGDLFVWKEQKNIIIRKKDNDTYEEFVTGKLYHLGESCFVKRNSKVCLVADVKINFKLYQ